jgi:hypothetical protein
MGYLDVKHPVYVYHNILPQMATVIVLMHQMSVSVIVCLMVFNATLNNIIRMSNTEKIWLPVVQYGKNNVRSHVLNECF